MNILAPGIGTAVGLGLGYEISNGTKNPFAKLAIIGAATVFGGLAGFLLGSVGGNDDAKIAPGKLDVKLSGGYYREPDGLDYASESSAVSAISADSSSEGYYGY